MSRARLGLTIAFSVLVAAAAAAPATAAGTIAFDPAEPFPTGSSIGPGPGAVTTVGVDADGDGDRDVVITDWTGDGPLVLRNDGSGAFGPAAPIAGAGDIGALASGDLNRDGRTDLVGRDGEGVVVLTGNGDGTFAVGARVAVSSNAQRSVTVLDVNGDQRLDVATPEQLGVRVLIGQGDGSLVAGPLFPLMGLLSAIATADVDGDTIVDLVVADATPVTQRIVALRGNGDGSFTQSGSGAVGYGPEAVMAGDLDGDGRDDAVSVDSFSAFNSPPTFSVTVLLGDGQGGFRPGATYPTGDGPVSGDMADFDGDGALDVVVSAVGSSVVTVYAGDGTGRLTEVAAPSVARQPQTPVAADFTGDGRPDIAVPGVGELSLLRNAVATTTVATPAPPAGASAPADETRSLPASGAMPPGSIGAGALAVALAVQIAIRAEQRTWRRCSRRPRARRCRS